MSYIIGTGWWCSEQIKDSRAQLLGDHNIRAQSFHRKWYEAVNKSTNPEKIIIVDSCSPIKPEIDQTDSRIELISLNINAGHSTNHIGKFCGYTRAIFLGLEYTLNCDVDYFVYIEQDALIYGEGIVEHCIRQMNKPYMYGSGRGTPGALQQSFFIMHRDGIQPFMDRIKKIGYTDRELSPEFKFHVSSCSFFPRIHAYFYRYPKRFGSKLISWQIWKYFKQWEDLPIGYGRIRPIEFSDEYFYFQHGSAAELAEYEMLSGSY